MLNGPPLVASEGGPFESLSGYELALDPTDLISTINLRLCVRTVPEGPYSSGRTCRSCLLVAA